MKNPVPQGGLSTQSQEQRTPPAATPQGRKEKDPHDIEMRDLEDDPNLPPPSEQGDDLLPVPVQAAQSGHPSRHEEDRGGRGR